MKIISKKKPMLPILLCDPFVKDSCYPGLFRPTTEKQTPVQWTDFLSSANKVSTGPTCQFLSVCVCVCVSFRSFFSRCLIGWYTGFWQWFWQPTYLTRCAELGWAVPHSDFYPGWAVPHSKILSWVFQVGIWCGNKQVWSTHRVDLKEDDL